MSIRTMPPLPGPRSSDLGAAVPAQPDRRPRFAGAEAGGPGEAETEEATVAALDGRRPVWTAAAGG